MTCGAKHTKFQPADAEWRCPKCGADAKESVFIICDPFEGADDDCPLLHDEDNVVCDNCGYGGSGKKVAAAMQKKSTSIPCPHCKGRGWISSKEVPK